VAEVQTNESVQKYTGGVLYSFKNALEYIKKTPKSLEKFYIIELKETCYKIGIVAVVPNSYIDKEEILISLLPNYWRKGYGCETLAAFKRSWLTSRKEERMFVTVMPKNSASISMLKKEGFEFVEKYKELNSSLNHHVYKYERKQT
jgi:RimJ/RimL family protein N-acetyltransferase